MAMMDFLIKFSDDSDLNWTYGKLKEFDKVGKVDPSNKILQVKGFNDMEELVKTLECLSVTWIKIVSIPIDEVIK